LINDVTSKDYTYRVQSNVDQHHCMLLRVKMTKLAWPGLVKNTKVSLRAHSRSLS
jgi:hypothetical protein